MKCFACLPAGFVLLLTSCSRRDTPAGPVRHYAFSGKIISLDKQHQTATIDSAAIPNYMEAMTMDYPVHDGSDFAALHVGEQIKATLDVASDETYTLTNVKPK